MNLKQRVERVRCLLYWAVWPDDSCTKSSDEPIHELECLRWIAATENRLSALLEPIRCTLLYDH